jgi:hypothetical protein
VTVLCISNILLMFFIGMCGTQNIEFCDATSRDRIGWDIQHGSVSIRSVLSALLFRDVVQRNFGNTECCSLLDYKPRINPSTRDMDIMYGEMFEIPCSCLWIMSQHAEGLVALGCVSCDYDTRCLCRSLTFHSFPMFILYER